MSPEESWRLRRASIGMNRTLPVDMDSQKALKAMRDSVATHHASSRGKARCGDRIGRAEIDPEKVTCNKCLSMMGDDARIGRVRAEALVREYVRLVAGA